MNKIKIVLPIALTFVIGINIAEEPTPSPGVTKSEDSAFGELFKTSLGDTDFIVCESSISVNVTRTASNLPSDENIFYLKLNKRGKDGKQTLKELELEIESAKSKALESCRKQNSHQECLTKGLINNQSTYTELDYQSRKAFLEGLVKSCEEQKATCKVANASKPECFINKFDTASTATKEASPAATPAEPAKPAGKK
jgi:hypothetical protein